MPRQVRLAALAAMGLAIGGLAIGGLAIGGLAVAIQAAAAQSPAQEPAQAPARRPARPAARSPDQAAPAPQAPAPPALSLDAYTEAAATTIIAEQSCPGVRLNAGQLTNLRLAARVGAGQEPVLEEKLRGRAAELRQRLASDGREAWCAAALDAFGAAGTVAKGVLSAGPAR